MPGSACLAVWLWPAGRLPGSALLPGSGLADCLGLPGSLSGSCLAVWLWLAGWLGLAPAASRLTDAWLCLAAWLCRALPSCLSLPVSACLCQTPPGCLTHHPALPASGDAQKHRFCIILSDISENHLCILQYLAPVALKTHHKIDTFFVKCSKHIIK